MQLDIGSLGPAYCYSSLYRDSQIDARYSCLEQQGIIKNSNQCIDQFKVDKDQEAKDTCLATFKIPANSDGCGAAKDCKSFCN